MSLKKLSIVIKYDLFHTENVKFCYRVAYAQRQVQIRSTNWEIILRGEEWKTGEKSSKNSSDTERV
jgi:hypothetical protein